MKPLEHLSDDEFAQLAQQAARLPDAPPTLLRAAIDQWDVAHPSSLQAAVQGALTRLVAALTFDSWTASPVAMGMRAMPAETRHLLFTAAGRDIDLRIVPAAGQFALTGQILGPDAAGVVQLSTARGADDAPGNARVVALDPLGEFRLDGVGDGTYVLTLRLGNDEIVLPPIAVGDHRT